MKIIPIIESSGSAVFAGADGDWMAAKYREDQYTSGPTIPIIVQLLEPDPDGSNLFKIDDPFRYFHALSVSGPAVRIEMYEKFQRVWSQSHSGVLINFRVDGNQQLWSCNNIFTEIYKYDDTDGSVDFTITLANIQSAIASADPPPSPFTGAATITYKSNIATVFFQVFAATPDGIVLGYRRFTSQNGLEGGEWNYREASSYLVFIDGEADISIVKISAVVGKEHGDEEENAVIVSHSDPYYPHLNIDPGDLVDLDSTEGIFTEIITLKNSVLVKIIGPGSPPITGFPSPGWWSNGDRLRTYDFSGAFVAGSSVYDLTSASSAGRFVSDEGEFTGQAISGGTKALLDEEFNDVTPGWMSQNAIQSTMKIRRPLCRTFRSTGTAFYMYNFETGEELYKAQFPEDDCLPPEVPYINTTWLGLFAVQTLLSPTIMTTLVIEASCISGTGPQNPPWWIQIDDTRTTSPPRNTTTSIVLMPHQWRENI